MQKVPLFGLIKTFFGTNNAKIVRFWSNYCIKLFINNFTEYKTNQGCLLESSTNGPELRQVHFHHARHAQVCESNAPTDNKRRGENCVC